MKRRTEVICLLGLLLALTFLNRAVTGSWMPPSGDAAIWYHAGLLMIIVGAYWVEHFFTKPADVAANGLIVFISVSMLTSPPHPDWWDGLRIFAVILAILACAVAWQQKPSSGTAVSSSSIWRIAYELVTRVGNAKVLFSVVFVLALISYFDVSSTQTKWMVIFWGVVIVLRNIELERIVGLVIGALQKDRPEIVGRVSRFVEPNIVRFHLADAATCRRGSIVAFTTNGISDQESPLGLVVGFRRAPDVVEAEAILVASTFVEGALDTRLTVTTTFDRERLSDSPLYRRQEHLVGIAYKDSDISRLHFELLNRNSALEEGHLVSVPANGRDLLFQVVNGRLHEEISLERGERTFTTGVAEQLGTWNPARQGFETHGWVVPENAPIFSVANDTTVGTEHRERLLSIGNVPNSQFPATISLNDLVLFHSAILGVTGSGKSFLAYQIIDACVAARIKVICLDITGDYKRWLTGAVRLEGSGQLKLFLNDPNAYLGIIEFQGAAHPIETAQRVSETALKWCEDNRLPDEVLMPVPKVLIVMEEAHSIIPEWNSNPVPGLNSVVTKTAQSVLQARKYGLGFMVVTQRTANVTKSILNQCNTILAFQAFDETGFDFMKNYMGEHYVRALPNLKRRQGVVVGKASQSDRPVIVRFNDQTRSPAGQIADYQPPVAVTNPQSLPPEGE